MKENPRNLQPWSSVSLCVCPCLMVDLCTERWGRGKKCQMSDLNVKLLWAQRSLWHFHLGAVTSATLQPADVHCRLMSPIKLEPLLLAARIALHFREHAAPVFTRGEERWIYGRGTGKTAPGAALQPDEMLESPTFTAFLQSDQQLCLNCQLHVQLNNLSHGF